MFRRALVLAAGPGSRLGAITAEIPKPMLRVRGKPVIERHVEQLAAAGVEEIWINLHHQGQVIQDYFGAGERWGARIRYSVEPVLLGTSGALKNLEREFSDGDFFVVYGDNLGACEYRTLAAAHRPGTLLTIALCHKDDVSASGIAELAGDGRILRFLEKPLAGEQFSHWVNTGFYAASPSLLPLLPEGASDFGRDVIPRLLAEGRPVRGFVLPAEVEGIDTPQMLEQADVLGVAVIGAGRMGARRAAVAAAAPGCRVLWVADPQRKRAQQVAGPCGAQASAEPGPALADPRVDCVVVSTSNDHLAVTARAAIEARKHLLVEKPAARSSAELGPLVSLAAERHLVFKTGFNYRFHPAIRRACELLRSGEIGRLLHAVARHGHGGRLGLETEWRARPDVAGGGELLDQGVHLIDLFRWASGEEIATAQAIVATEFWPIQPLEDAAFCLFRTASGVTFSLAVSLMEWKNRFQFELTGERGALLVEGLGGSYGPERLTITRRPEQFGAPQQETIEFENPDQCWAAEWAEFMAAIREGRAPLGDAQDSLAALRAVEACYRSARESRTVPC
ncbi:MAG: Gfo/Idh/MocA family oxidoreductase [Acidobacteria bacterium]|nr:Gfo/Idh/MocA family oxidoreductase [Acidobacteriota bacterium]